MRNWCTWVHKLETGGSHTGAFKLIFVGPGILHLPGSWFNLFPAPYINSVDRKSYELLVDKQEWAPHFSAPAFKQPNGRMFWDRQMRTSPLSNAFCPSPADSSGRSPTPKCIQRKCSRSMMTLRKYICTAVMLTITQHKHVKNTSPSIAEPNNWLFSYSRQHDEPQNSFKIRLCVWAALPDEDLWHY